MRVTRLIVLLAVSALSLVYILGYARTVLLLHPVRPDPGALLVFEPDTVVYFDYANPGSKGLHCSPFFPPCFDLPLYSAQVLRVPCWIVVLGCGGMAFYTGRCFIRWRGSPNETSGANAPGRSLFRLLAPWAARIAHFCR